MNERPDNPANPGAPRSDGPRWDGSAPDRASAEFAPEPGIPTPAGEAAPPAGDLAQLQKERDEYRDQVLRCRAEFANYQKRAKQQADTERIYAVGSLARDLLDPIDNLDRAAEALRASGAEGVTAGIDMVQKQLLSILAKHGVEPIPALGQPFDPNLHDAIVQQPSANQPEGLVVGEFSKGYRIHDRVLRPSKVAVSVMPRDK
jgi:molecular chaperone GrpE